MNLSHKANSTHKQVKPSIQFDFIAASRKQLCTTILTLSFLTLSSCVAVVGPSVNVPEIPVGDAVSIDENITSSISLGSFRDVRSEPVENRISPEGDVTAAVKAAFKKSLEKRNGYVIDNASVTVMAEVRNWHAITKGTGEIESDASLYIEVHVRDKGRIFSGLFHGHRASTFPLISAQDIDDSLGLAMAQAIDQVLYDRAVISALNGR